MTIQIQRAKEEPNHSQRAELLWIQAAQVKLLQDPHFKRLKGLLWYLEMWWTSHVEGGTTIWRKTPNPVAYRQHHLTTLVL